MKRSPGAIALIAGVCLFTFASCTPEPPRVPQSVAWTEPPGVPTSVDTVPPVRPCLGIQVTPRDDLQSEIDHAPPGARFCFADGLYRIAKSLSPNGGNTFVGSRNAILDGSVVVTGWAPAGSGRWAAHIPSPKVPVSPYRCRPSGDVSCHWDGDLFFDGVHLKPVETRSRLKPGHVFVSQDARMAYIAQDPRGHLVEEAVSDAIIDGKGNWTVDGLTIQKAANPVQHGALDGDDITVQNSEVRLNHGVGVYGRENSMILRNYIHDNGQMGFSGHNGPITIVGNEIARNNTDGFEWHSEAGGGKCYECTDALISGNISHDNGGPGIWCDTDCVRVVIENNRVYKNTGPGIYYEISRNGIIRNNVVSRNAFDPGTDMIVVGGGISVESSATVEVYGNSLDANGNGIVLVARNRGAGAFGTHRLDDVSVHNNLIRQSFGRSGLVNRTGNNRFWTSLGNEFRDNSYILGGERYPFDWLGAKRTIDEWVDFGQDVEGRFG